VVVTVTTRASRTPTPSRRGSRQSHWRAVRLKRAARAKMRGVRAAQRYASNRLRTIGPDAGTTWRDSGRGLPAGRAVAIDDLDPDVVVFAARNRLYLSRDGGLFWTSLPVELPEIDTVALREA
jgi:hypothetical protein